MQNRRDEDLANPDNPVASVRHLTAHGTDKCLGKMVLLWCPGCQALHAPRFRCPDHGGPPDGPVWDGDPYSDPFTMSPSYLVNSSMDPKVCHSFVRNGQWEFLGDCTHALAGKTVPLEPLPNWLIREVPED